MHPAQTILALAGAFGAGQMVPREYAGRWRVAPPEPRRMTEDDRSWRGALRCRRHINACRNFYTGHWQHRAADAAKA
jgi:hypothetical protein